VGGAYSRSIEFVRKKKTKEGGGDIIEKGNESGAKKCLSWKEKKGMIRRSCLFSRIRRKKKGLNESAAREGGPRKSGHLGTGWRGAR